MSYKIGFIGLGQMGGRMCKRLLAAGHQVTAFDASPARIEEMVKLGAAQGKSPKDVAAQADYILLSLPDSAVVESVVLGADGVIHGAKPGAVLIDMTSSKPMSTRKIAAELEKIGVKMLDAPVSRGTMGAEKGTLSMMVGGDPAVLEQCQPFLSVLATDIYHIGPTGAGHIVKSLNNLVSSTCFLITTEAIALGVKAGLDAKVVNEVLNGSSGKSYATEKRFPDLVFTNKLDSGFSMRLMQKDVGIALELAQQLMAPMPIGANTLQVYTDIMAQGKADKDNMHYVEIMEEKVKAKLR